MGGLTVSISEDGGLSWDKKSISVSTNDSLVAITASADLGRIATVDSLNQFHVSTDGGQNWINRPLILDGQLIDSAMSAVSSGGGYRMLVANSTGALWRSSQSGGSWDAVDRHRRWEAVAVSADGGRMIAGGLGSSLHLSDDAGSSWAPVGPTNDWTALAASSDGAKLFAGTASGAVYCASNSPVSWQQRTRSTYLSLDGGVGDAQLAAGVYFSSAAFTVESWVYAGSAQSDASILDFGDANGQNRVVLGLGNGDSLRPSAQVFRGTSGGDLLSSPVALTIGDWAHVAFVFDVESANSTTGSMTIYIDGVAVTNGTVNTPNAVERSQCFVGNRANGGIDELRIWAQARTAGDVVAGMVSAVSTDAEGLSTAFDFGNADTNHVVSDVTGTGNDLRIAGVATLLRFSGASLALDVSSSGRHVTAAVEGGRLMTSADFGATWQARAVDTNWTSVALSASGLRQVAAVTGGGIWTSGDTGVSWFERLNDQARTWRSVAASDDGTRMAAAESDGFIYVSTDSGENWNLTGDTRRHWTSVSMSGGGTELLATTTNAVFTSADFGATWTERPLTQISGWALAANANGTRLKAIPGGTQGLSLVSDGFYLGYEADPISGVVRVRAPNAVTNIVFGVNTNLTSVPKPFPLRLIVHHDDRTGGAANMFQRIFSGFRTGGTNFAVTPYEELLDPQRLASARRISAVHLPYARTNRYWTSSSGQFGGSLVFDVNLDYRDHESNPFLHGFHPDHDNLSVDFKTVQVSGNESYGVRRKITLAFGGAAEDFQSLTEVGRRFDGTYREDLFISGTSGGAGRNYHLEGAFTLYRVLDRRTLTLNAATPADAE